MPYLIACPTCRRQLRVQAEYAGKPLACPSCNAVFLAPHPPPEVGPAGLNPAAHPAGPNPAGHQPSEPSGEEGYWIEGPRQGAPGSTLTELYTPRFKRSKKRQRAKSAVLAPAICLIILGGMAFCFYALSLAVAVIDPTLGEADAARAQRLRIDPDKIHLFQTCWLVAFTLGGAYVAIAGLYMLSLRGHSFALSGAYLAMIPCCVGLGCVPGIAFGIWSLVVLYNSDVRSAFR